MRALCNSSLLSRSRVFSKKGPRQKINQSPRISSHRLQIEAAAADQGLAFTCPQCKRAPGDKLIFSVTPTQSAITNGVNSNIKEPFLVTYRKLPDDTDWIEIELGEICVVIKRSCISHR
jgi:hypothetical protein